MGLLINYTGVSGYLFSCKLHDIEIQDVTFKADLTDRTGIVPIDFIGIKTLPRNSLAVTVLLETT